ncbi:unnamed protein product [Peniophora sp. CBMAI 1063]|nr:unnamed protein product [Peniophora sp. CBMAI 1063]
MLNTSGEGQGRTGAFEPSLLEVESGLRYSLARGSVMPCIEKGLHPVDQVRLYDVRKYLSGRLRRRCSKHLSEKTKVTGESF